MRRPHGDTDADIKDSSRDSSPGNSQSKDGGLELGHSEPSGVAGAG